MRTVQSEQKSGKDAPLLEWQTCDSDSEWQTPQQEALTITLLHPEGAQRTNWKARHWWLGATLPMILVIIGVWTWSVAQSGIAQIEADLRDTVELDLWTTATHDDGLQPASEQEFPERSASAQDGAVHPMTSTVQLLAFSGETAIVQFVTQPTPDQPSLRQTRFYQRTTEGWLQTKPDANLWGRARQLESSQFIFEFRQNDTQVVAAVVPQIDELYTELERNFGLRHQAEKPVIEVSVERITGAIPVPGSSSEPFVVPSPAVYLAPIDLSDSAILAQSIAFPLIDYMGDRATKEHAIPARWNSLLSGVRLWQLWDLDMPLARWRQELVKWLYIDAPSASIEQLSLLPNGYSELCAMHSLWMLSPLAVGIPLECSSTDAISWSPRQWPVHVPPTRLDELRRDELRVPLADWENSSKLVYYSSGAVAAANLVEYAVATYGYEKLPMLLDGLAQHDDWKTLAPDVFGVSADAFESGWRSYLAQKYNASLDH